MRYPLIANEIVEYMREHRAPSQGIHRPMSTDYSIYIIAEQINKEKEKVYLTAYEMSLEKPDWFPTGTIVHMNMPVITYKEGYDFLIKVFMEDGGFVADDKKKKQIEKNANRESWPKRNWWVPLCIVYLAGWCTPTASEYIKNKSQALQIQKGSPIITNTSATHSNTHIKKAR